MDANSLPPYRLSLLERLFAWWAQRVDRTMGWQRLPRYTGAFVLGGLRTVLRKENLYDTSHLPSVHVPPAPPVEATDHRRLTARSADGCFNDLQHPDMGRVGSRFGRNVPLADTYPGSDGLILTPNPRRVSRELLTRERFIPATSLNLLAAAWLQFMVHDWLSHGKNQKERPWLVQLEADDDWPRRPMEILRTHADPTRPEGSDGSPPTYLNTATHWWDASQIYGSGPQIQQDLRSGDQGKLKIEADGMLLLDPSTGIARTGVSGNWWLGLDLMHTVFTLEHNAICDHLHDEYPAWSDQELFDRARLVNAALLAKIHTVEWTPAILAHPTLEIAMNANWWGVAGERLKKVVGRISGAEWLSGIPGSETNHFGVPYTITEEFVAVYRMHPLLRDDYVFRRVEDDAVIEQRAFPDVAFRNARLALERAGMANALYSFGVMNPGAVTLHNHPRAMQRLEKPDGSLNDLAAIDVLRNRERGVPRYNRFRQLMHKPPLTRFEDLTDNPEWVEQIRRVYNDDLDLVDLLIGLYAEPVPPGFGFSDTAFRIFILMASRRLNSDRFFTTDFTPEVYSPAGMSWLEDNSFTAVLLRHFPDLRPVLRSVENPFAPWPRVGSLGKERLQG